MSSVLCTSTLQRGRFFRSSTSYERGFTMLETLVVLAIVLVISAGAVVRFTTSSSSYRLKNDSRNLANLLNFARMKGAASFDRSQVSCNTAVTPTLCSIVLYDPSGNSTSLGHNSTTAAKAPEVVLSKGVSLTVPSGVSAGPTNSGQSGGAYEGHSGQTGSLFTVNFNTRGLPVSSPTSSSATPDRGYAYYLTDTTGNSIAITVDLSGNSSLWRLDSGSGTWAQMRD